MYSFDEEAGYWRQAAETLEKVEKLEQLRALEHGYRIAVGLTDDSSIGVDTPEDLARVAPMLLASDKGVG